LPIAVKGILTAEDARLAAEAGIDAIFVSNHGGRQVDCTPSAVSEIGFFFFNNEERPDERSGSNAIGNLVGLSVVQIATCHDPYSDICEIAWYFDVILFSLLR